MLIPPNVWKQAGHLAGPRVSGNIRFSTQGQVLPRSPLLTVQPTIHEDSLVLLRPFWSCSEQICESPGIRGTKEPGRGEIGTGTWQTWPIPALVIVSRRSPFAFPQFYVDILIKIPEKDSSQHATQAMRVAGMAYFRPTIIRTSWCVQAKPLELRGVGSGVGNYLLWRNVFLLLATTPDIHAKDVPSA